jgi:hypothetical protein
MVTLGFLAISRILLASCCALSLEVNLHARRCEKFERRQLEEYVQMDGRGVAPHCVRRRPDVLEGQVELVLVFMCLHPSTNTTQPKQTQGSIDGQRVCEELNQSLFRGRICSQLGDTLLIEARA